MKKIFIILIILGTISPLILSAQIIDINQSKVEFNIGSFGFLSVDGTFGGMTGSVNFSPNNLNDSKFDVCIKAKTISTGIKMRDEHLRDEDFLHVEKYPNICFTSQEIKKDGAKYSVKGSLTLHGITKLVLIPFEYKNGTLKGEFVINRSDYKIGENTGRFSVGEEVTITIVCVLK